MSRTHHGSKAPGFDYWSKRPHSGFGHGPDAKFACHKTERQIAARELRSAEVGERAADLADDRFDLFEGEQISRLYRDVGVLA